MQCLHTGHKQKTKQPEIQLNSDKTYIYTQDRESTDGQPAMVVQMICTLFHVPVCPSVCARMCVCVCGWVCACIGSLHYQTLLTYNLSFHEIFVKNIPRYFKEFTTGIISPSKNPPLSSCLVTSLSKHNNMTLLHVNLKLICTCSSM